MKTTTVKRILIGSTALFVLLLLVLITHIYIVTRPKVPNPDTKAMARIDIKHQLTPADAADIATWFYQQPGVDHVMCNAAGKVVVFTFFPSKMNADHVTDQFKSQFNLSAVRHVPTEAELLKGCPISTATTNKVYQFFKETF